MNTSEVNNDTANQEKRVLYEIAEKINEHWILKTILAFLPSVWFPIIVDIFGRFLYISTDDGLTRVGIWITVFVYLVVVLILILSNFASKRDTQKAIKNKEEESALNSNIKFLDNLLSTTRKMSSESSNNIFEALNQYGKVPQNDFLDFVSKAPSSRLKFISNEICRCLHEMSSIPCDRIAVSIAYKFSNDPSWSWGDRYSAGGGLPLSELQSNPSTLFYRMANNQIKSPFVYIEDKKDAAGKNMYVEDDRDAKYRGVGSLVGLKIPVGASDNPLVTILIFVSTYSDQISKSESEKDLVNVEENLKSILSIFEDQISAQILLRHFQLEYQKTEKEKDEGYKREIEQIRKAKSDIEYEYYKITHPNPYSGIMPFSTNPALIDCLDLKTGALLSEASFNFEPDINDNTPLST